MQKPGQILKHRNKIESSVYIILFAIISACYWYLFRYFRYTDLETITKWGYEVCDLIRIGKFHDIYAFLAENTRDAVGPPVGTNYICLLPIAIWTFPAWLINGGSRNLSIPQWGYLWTELLYVLCAGLMVFFIIEIVKTVRGSVQKLEKIQIALLIFASPELILSIAYAGQDEIVYLFFFFWGLYYFLSKRNMRAFIILSMISISLCPLMLLPYVVIILICEKRIARIMLYGVFSLLPGTIVDIAHRHDEAFSKLKVTAWATVLLNNQVIQITGLSVSVIAMLLALILICCYFKANYNYKAGENVCGPIWIMSMAVIVFCILSGDHFYRFFIYVPFMIILIFQTESNRNAMLFFYFMLQCGRTIQCIFANGRQVLNAKYAIADITNNANISQVILGLRPGLESFDGLVGALIMVSSIVILYMTSRDNQQEYTLNIKPVYSVIGCCIIMPLIIGLCMKFIL